MTVRFTISATCPRIWLYDMPNACILCSFRPMDCETFGLPDDLVQQLIEAHRAYAEKPGPDTVRKVCRASMRLVAEFGDVLDHLRREDLQPDSFELHRIIAMTIKARENAEKALREVTKEDMERASGEVARDTFLHYMEKDSRPEPNDN